jgi:acetylornithine deacetylase
MSLMPSESTLAHVGELLAFRSVTRRSNLDLIEWAEARFKALGARVVWDYSEDRTRANLFATFGEGPGGWVLSGHSDVVPVDGQDWTVDPFAATLRDGRLYGRGACDMKGFIGVVLAQAGDWGGLSLSAPIHVALTYDEESGCLGVPGLLRQLQAVGIQPNGCIVGEPTDMQVVTAHKGGRVYRCRVRGCAAHSSLTPQGVNAIEYAARLISFIQDLSWREAGEGLRDDGFAVPFTTISTNTIAGGNGRNIIPADCEFFFDYRYVPGMPASRLIDEITAYAREQLEPRMRRVDPAAGFEFECINGIPALNATEQDRITRLAQSLLRPHRPGKVSYGTEAGFFQEAGIPSVVCGPGSIEQAHKADEYVELAQLAQCERFVSGLVERLRVPATV